MSLRTFDWHGLTLAALRIASGLLLVQHGTAKLFGFPGGDRANIDLNTLVGWSGPIEFAGGLLIILGLFTRPVAFVLSGFMAAAYFIGHASRGLFPLLNGGELAALYCFVFLFIAAAGPGMFAVDRRR
ncbi:MULTISPECIES: DoxX family protein [Brevundimonas]|uniref:DoxX family protein n=2 Tax=Brevundimonas TaxID=41275 RepID=A0ABN0YJ36_9CAUL|nr:MULTISPECIES: DoxX family protein [Brevundimonas]NIJ27027.1 putative oxidoreductase [Brevundimonas terrae]